MVTDMKNYLVIYEPGEHNWSAFCPDVPGCVAAGRTRLDTERLMAKALALHLAGMEEDGDTVPTPSGIEADYVQVDFEPRIAHSRDQSAVLA